MSNIVGKIRPLIDKDGNYVFPETSVDAVYFPDGTTVSDKLEGTVFFDEDVDTIEIEKADGVKRLDNLESSVSGITSQLDTIKNEIGYLTQFKRQDNESDTDYLNRFFSEMNAKNIRILKFDGKSYTINTNGLIIYSNQKIDLNGSTLTIETNNLESYHIFRPQKLKNIEFKNGFLIGDKDTHTGSTGEWGFGIRLDQCENVIIDNMECSKFWGDGIYIGSVDNNGYCKNVTITNTLCDNNRRQGLSVISVDGLFIDNSKFNNTNGTAPQCGIDFEPNFPTQVLKNIKLNNIETTNNTGGGILTYLAQLNNSSEYVDIEINNHSGKGSLLCYCNGIPASKVNGSIVYNNSNYILERNCAFSLNKTTNSPDLIINNPTITIHKDYPSTSTVYSNLICSQIETTALDSDILGGYSIINPTVICNDNSPQSIRNLLYAINKKSADKVANISLINPIIIGNIERFSGIADLNLGTEIPLNNNIYILDSNRCFHRERANYTQLKLSYFSTIIFSNATADRTAQLNSMPPNIEILFVNKDVTGWKLTLTGVDIDGATSYIVAQNKKALLRSLGNGKWTVLY